MPAPSRLRPYLGFAKAPNTALELCRKVVDEDDGFRRRVAAEATVDQVGSVGWLWLTRPENWEATIAELQAQAERARLEQGTARHRDELARRQAAVRETLEQAEQARRRLAAELEATRAELADHQRRLREARSALDASDAELARVREDRAGLLRQLKSAEALIARHGADLRGLQHEHDALQEAYAAQADELEKYRASEHDADAPAPAIAMQGAGAERAGIEDAETDSADMDRAGVGAPAPRRTSAVPAARPTPAAASPALRTAIDAASHAAASLSAALAAAASALDHADAGPDLGATASPAARGANRSAAPAGESMANRRGPALHGAPSPIRRPLKMPPGTFEETAEAADYLVRVPRMLFLVDGYNVAKLGWPDLELRLQRDRLVEALVALQARTGVQADVVFDGIDEAALQARTAPGRLRVEFTASDVEADDRLLALVELTPLSRPVVVVSNDRRVRDGARRRGANTLSSQQLLWLLR